MKCYSSPYFVASDELLQSLQQDYVRDNDKSHATLTQLFLMPRTLATAVLKKEVQCHVHNRAFWIPDQS